MRITRNIFFLTGYFALTLLTLLLGAALLRCREELWRLERSFTTMPLRDDLRAKRVFELGEYFHFARFFDNDHLIYVRDNELVIRSFLDTMESVRRFPGHTNLICDFAVSPDRKRVVSTSEDGTVRVWDARNGVQLAVSEPLDTLDQPLMTLLMDVCFTQGGRRILTADMYGIKTWRTRDCKLLDKNEADLFYMRPGMIAPDGKTCCAPGFPTGFEIMQSDGEILLWREGFYECLAYSPDAKYLLIADTDTGFMQGWDIPLLRRKKGTYGFVLFLSQGTVMTCAAYSDDGKQLVTGAENGCGYVWNAKTGSLRETLRTDEKHIDGVCFSPDGCYILAYSHRLLPGDIYGSTYLYIWGPPH